MKKAQYHNTVNLHAPPHFRIRFLSSNYAWSLISWAGSKVKQRRKTTRKNGQIHEIFLRCYFDQYKLNATSKNIDRKHNELVTMTWQNPSLALLKGFKIFSSQKSSFPGLKSVQLQVGILRFWSIKDWVKRGRTYVNLLDLHNSSSDLAQPHSI